FARQGTALEIHNMVGQRDGSRVEQARIDLQQRFAALESVVDPFRAGVQICCRARDDRRGRENGGDVVENWVRSFGQPVGLVSHQGLINVPKWVLQRVEQLGQLEAEKFLGVEVSDA